MSRTASTPRCTTRASGRTRAGLTTLIVAHRRRAQALREGIAAWKLAFAGDPRRPADHQGPLPLRQLPPDDPRIRFVDANEPSRGIAHWYREADVLLALGNEGFGLPLVEGMATGLPVVALDSEGQCDVCRDAGDLVLRRPAGPLASRTDDPRSGRRGVRGVPDVEPWPRGCAGWRSTATRRASWGGRRRVGASRTATSGERARRS